MHLGNKKGKEAMAKAGDDAKAALTEFIGKEPEYIDTGMAMAGKQSYSGTGIALSDGRLYILDEGVAAELPWIRIRRWSWNVGVWKKSLQLEM